MPGVEPGGIFITVDIGGDNAVEVTPADNEAQRDTAFTDT